MSKREKALTDLGRLAEQTIREIFKDPARDPKERLEAARILIEHYDQERGQAAIDQLFHS
jgi:hypothetical protein